ncbi:MAG: hypothetical protein UR15_C0027G0003 [Parcubacteria group bacterium GW2011_GWA2_31_28]|nr:MAG: hypothetical protein UR15_C0027G0003 [Parcubacteria group bacterium GW2011_GWA2_31_28]
MPKKGTIADKTEKEFGELIIKLERAIPQGDYNLNSLERFLTNCQNTSEKLKVAGGIKNIQFHSEKIKEAYKEVTSALVGFQIEQLKALDDISLGEQDDISFLREAKEYMLRSYALTGSASNIKEIVGIIPKEIYADLYETNKKTLDRVSDFLLSKNQGILNLIKRNKIKDNPLNYLDEYAEHIAGKQNEVVTEFFNRAKRVLKGEIKILEGRAIKINTNLIKEGSDLASKIVYGSAYSNGIYDLIEKYNKRCKDEEDIYSKLEAVKSKAHNLSLNVVDSIHSLIYEQLPKKRVYGLSEQCREYQQDIEKLKEVAQQIPPSRKEGEGYKQVLEGLNELVGIAMQKLQQAPELVDGVNKLNQMIQDYSYFVKRGEIELLEQDQTSKIVGLIDKIDKTLGKSTIEEELVKSGNSALALKDIEAIKQNLESGFINEPLRQTFTGIKNKFYECLKPIYAKAEEVEGKLVSYLNTGKGINLESIEKFREDAGLFARILSLVNVAKDRYSDEEKIIINSWNKKYSHLEKDVDAAIHYLRILEEAAKEHSRVRAEFKDVENKEYLDEYTNWFVSAGNLLNQLEARLGYKRECGFFEGYIKNRLNNVKEEIVASRTDIQNYISNMVVGERVESVKGDFFKLIAALRGS